MKSVLLFALVAMVVADELKIESTFKPDGCDTARKTKKGKRQYGHIGRQRGLRIMFLQAISSLCTTQEPSTVHRNPLSTSPTRSHLHCLAESSKTGEKGKQFDSSVGRGPFDFARE